MEDRGACVILDTNQWDRVPMLRHRLAAPLLFSLRRRGAFIGLPEVIRAEVLLHLVESHSQALRESKKAAGKIRQILGEARDPEEQSDDDVRRAFERRLGELDDLIVELEVTEEDLVRAGQMVLAMTPPNSRHSQQFKDSVIWRVVARAAKDQQVIFVTDDGAFYGASGSLAPELQADLGETHYPVTIFRKLEDLLEHWRDEGPALDAYELSDVVNSAVLEELETELPKHTSLVVGDVEDWSTEAFLTDVPNELVVSATFEYRLLDPEFLDADTVALARVEASATVDVDLEEVREISLDRLTVELLSPHGDINVANVVFGSATLGGSRAKRYVLRVPLELGP